MLGVDELIRIIDWLHLDRSTYQETSEAIQQDGSKHGKVAAACRGSEEAGIGVPAGQVQAGKAGPGRYHASRAVRL